MSTVSISNAISGVHTALIGTNSFLLPRGTTAQRPTLTVNEAGAIRSNSTLERIERYNGVSFRQVGIHGHFTSSHLADISITNTPQAVPFNTNDIDSGTSISHSTTTNNSRFLINDNGVYVFNFQAQVTSQVANPTNVYFWLKRNGVSITNTATHYRTTGNTSTAVIASEVNLELVAGDYIEFFTQADTNGEYILNHTAATGDIPAAPAIIVSIRGW